MTGTSPRVLGLASLMVLATCLAACDRADAPARAVTAAAVPTLSIQELRVASAHKLTSYAGAKVPAWDVRANASGHDCGILLVELGVNMEDTLVDGLQYGVDPYAVTEGGVQTFSREHSFLAVAYRDAAGRIWTYGPVARTDAESFVPCR